MKLIRSLLFVGALSAVSLGAQVAPAPKIAVVDMAKLFNNHYETQIEKTKLDDATGKAKDEFDRLSKDIDALVAEYKESDQESKNPLATSEAKSKASSDAQKKSEEIRLKAQDRETFANNARQTLQQRVQTFRGMMLEEIAKTVLRVAKVHDATIVFDKSGPTLLGIPGMIYADAAYDITDEVQAEINKSRPPAATPPITVPGIVPSK